VHYHVHKRSPSLGRILSQFIPLLHIRALFSNVLFNVILSTTRCSLEVSESKLCNHFDFLILLECGVFGYVHVGVIKFLY
jgi:hypothetical protein